MGPRVPPTPVWILVSAHSTCTSLISWSQDRRVQTSVFSIQGAFSTVNLQDREKNTGGYSQYFHSNVQAR